MRFNYLALAALLLLAIGCKKPEPAPEGGQRSAVSGQPETRNEKPETRNEKQETRNEKTETRNEKQETRNEKTETRNKKRETRNEKTEAVAVKQPPAGPSRTLDELLDLVSGRQTCNIVMGCEARDGLIAIGAPAVEPIIQRYRVSGRPSYQRFHLIEILGYIDTPEVLPFLEQCLADPHWNARANAAIALGRLNAVSKLGLIKRLLKKHVKGRDFGFVYALAYAAEKLGTTGGKTVLLKALTEESVGSINWGYTRVAVFAAADLQLKQACPDLVHSVLHNDVFLKKEAMGAAMTLNCRQEDLAEAIAAELSSRIPSVRRKAAAALEKLGGKK